MHTPYDIFIDLSDQMPGSMTGKKPSIVQRDSDVHDVELSGLGPQARWVWAIFVAFVNFSP